MAKSGNYKKNDYHGKVGTVIGANSCTFQLLPQTTSHTDPRKCQKISIQNVLAPPTTRPPPKSKPPTTGTKLPTIQQVFARKPK
ncbi:hypothetical protein VNO80_10663 [Phaseolus coccineus]|uniref:Uncharacterized protein n=1 Tax=Phaseolus coccineus TaxID=3886 RepID=A0AAN9N8U2_PHACN